jgi:hypothetical protein
MPGKRSASSDTPQQRDSDERVAAVARLRDDPLGLGSGLRVAGLPAHHAEGVAVDTERSSAQLAVEGVADGEGLSAGGIHAHAEASEGPVPVVRTFLAAPRSERVELLDVQEDEIVGLLPRGFARRVELVCAHLQDHLFVSRPTP